MKSHMLRLLAAFTIILILQGCAETIVAGGSVAVVAAFDPRPVSTIVTDQISDYKVSRLLKKNKYVDEDAHINTLVYNDTLLITGEVRSKWLKQYISDLVTKVDGVKKVHNYLNITKPSPEESRSEDAALTTRIMSQLSANNIDDAELRVVTESKTVYLLGLVDTATQQKAVTIAKRLQEVRSVVPLFESVS